MTTATIDASALKSIRKARKIGRPKLAKLVGLSERQIAKVETGVAVALAPAQVDALSLALDVPTAALTGEHEIEADMLPPAEKPASSCGCCG